MQPTEQNRNLKCANILVTPRGLAEIDGKKVVLFVPSAEVDHIILRFGRADHRPAISMFLGIIFALMGIYGLAEFILAPRGFRYEMGMVFFGFVGGVLIFDAIKKRYFLEVHKSKGDCRLIFSKDAQLTDIQDFCKKIRTIHQYKITENM
jgi:hypothetical protein